MTGIKSTYVAAVIGALLGAGGVWLLSATKGTDTDAEAQRTEPLYWVAPMDPNYRRGEPGKSPMGMDLVPVYEEPESEGVKGAVSISPNIVNNLGVRTARVTSGRISETIQSVGYVQYDEDRLIHLHPRVEGWIESLYVKAAGDRVEKGERLYALYSPTLVNAQEEYLLALKRNNPALIDAALSRLSALQVPQAAISRLRETREVSQTIDIVAPQSGVIDNLGVREGMYVTPNLALMTIGQLEHIWLIGEIFERQAGRVQTGDKVAMELDYLPGRQWSGQVDYIYPSLNEQARTLQFRVTMDNPGGLLKPGMFATLTIDAQPGPTRVMIPAEALIRTGQQSRVVLAYGEGEFKSVAVTPGRIADGQAEILAGLEVGDHIVTSAQFLIDSESSKTSDFKRISHADPSAGRSHSQPGHVMEGEGESHHEMDHGTHSMTGNHND